MVVAQAADLVERRELSLARAKCSSCGGSFTLYPADVYPGRRFQLDAVADTVARVVLGGERVADAARAVDTTASSVRRWAAWIAILAEPAALVQATARVDPDGPPGAGLSSVTAAHPRRARAARVLAALEALGLALARAGVAAATAVRTGLARVLHWQHAAHGDVVAVGARLSPRTARAAEEVAR
jgi:transposase-like protein